MHAGLVVIRYEGVRGLLDAVMQKAIGGGLRILASGRASRSGKACTRLRERQDQPFAQRRAQLGGGLLRRDLAGDGQGLQVEALADAGAELEDVLRRLRKPADLAQHEVDHVVRDSQPANALQVVAPGATLRRRRRAGPRCGSQ